MLEIENEGGSVRGGCPPPLPNKRPPTTRFHLLLISSTIHHTPGCILG